MKKPLAQDDQISELIKALEEQNRLSRDNPIHVYKLSRMERLKSFLACCEGNQKNLIAEGDVLKMINQDKDQNVN